MVRRFSGHRPAADRWDLEAEIEDPVGVIWQVWIRRADIATTGYVNAKVAADGRVKHKANYWVAYGPNGMTKAKDVFIMKENSPWLFERVKDVLAEALSGSVDVAGQPAQGQSALV